MRWMEMVDRGGGGCASLQLEFNFFATKESRKRAKRGLYTAEGRKEKEGWDGSGDSKRGERRERIGASRFKKNPIRANWMAPVRLKRDSRLKSFFEFSLSFFFFHIRCIHLSFRVRRRFFFFIQTRISKTTRTKLLEIRLSLVEN